MAEAVRNTRTVERIITEEIDDGVVLTLTQNEADTLADVLRCIGGDPLTTRRGVTSKILRALEGAGIHRKITDARDVVQALKFTETE